MVPDSDSSGLALLLRAEQAQSYTLQEQVAELAEAVAQVDLDVARVHEGIAAQGGSLAAQAREHANRAREFAAKEYAEADRLRGGRAGRGSWTSGNYLGLEVEATARGLFCVRENRAGRMTCDAG